MTTGKTIALTRQTFVGKVMSLLFNILSRLVIAFFPKEQALFNFMAAVTICSDIQDSHLLNPEKEQQIWRLLGETLTILLLILIPKKVKMENMSKYQQQSSLLLEKLKI